MTEPTEAGSYSKPTSRRLVGALGVVAVFALMLAAPLVPSAAVHAGLAPMGSPVGVAGSSPLLIPHPLSLPVVGGHYLGTNVPVGPVPSLYVGHSARSLAPSPRGSSTSANFYVTGSDCAGWGLFPGSYQFPIGFAGSSVAAVPGSNTTLLAAGGSLIGAYNGTGGTPCNTISISPEFALSGATGVWKSTDGGLTWNLATFLSINTSHWALSTDPSNGSVHWGSASIAAGPSNSVMVADVYVNGCYFGSVGCTNATGIQGDWGISVTRSTDGGTTFQDSIQLQAVQGLKYFSMGTCPAPYSSGYYYYNVPEHPTIAINPSSGLAVLTWDVYQATVSSATCSVAGHDQVFVSISTDSGKTWSAPKGLSGDLSANGGVSIGPAPTYAITSAFMDYQNGTASSLSVETTRSTNNGTSWSIPKDVVLAGLFPPSQVTTNYFLPTIPELAVDSNSGSAYKDYAYLTWADNGNITTNPGYATVEVAVSSNGGSTFSSPVAILPTTTSIGYYEPTVSVAPNGNVWVTFYGFSLSTLNYNTYAVVSTDGGTSWSHPFIISDSISTPGTSIYDLGEVTGSAATTNGVYPIWTDCRASTCYTDGDAQLIVGNVHAVSLSANIAGVTATVNVNGASTSLALPGTVAWDNASQNSVSVPQTLPDPFNTSDVYSFHNFTGLIQSVNFQVTVSYAGTDQGLVANYVAVPATVLKGVVGPIVAGLAVKINNVPVSLTPFNATAEQWTETVPGGLVYSASASATNFVTQTHSFATGQGGTYWWNVTLVRASGTIAGKLTPYSATLTVNGSAVTGIPVSGQYSVNEPFGWYWVNASGTGLTSFSQYVEVLANQTKVVNIVLSGGWIQGVVTGAQPSKGTLVVKVDGVKINVTSAGTFNNSTIGGYHTITTTQPGFNLSSVSLFVSPGRTTLVNITLTNRGWLSGLVQPAAAAKIAVLRITSSGGAGGFAAITNGAFNYSTVGGVNYTVNVTATGYTSFEAAYPVTAGNGTLVPTIVLQPVSTGCTGPSCNQPPPNNNGSTSGSGISTTTLIIIVVVIVAVAAVAVVLLTRRRGGGGAQPTYDPGQGVYQESDPADLPRLQADGSMGPGNPPPSG